MKRSIALTVSLCLLFGVVVAQDGETDAEKLQRLRKAAEDIQDADTIAHAALRDYTECHELGEKAEFAALLPELARRAAEKAEKASWSAKANAGLRLHKDKYAELAAPLLRAACDEMKKAGKATRVIHETREDGTRKLRIESEPRFLDVVEALGWQAYEYPEEMNLAVEYDVNGALEYSAYYNYDVEQLQRDIKRFPPDVIERLKSLEDTAIEAWKELVEADKKDGFAFKARKAWIRFKNANDSKARADRAKGKRSFSPKAMLRETEKFDSIWMYEYAAPFVVYVEKPIGEPPSEKVRELLHPRLRLLGELHDWFRTNFVEPFELKRVKPQYSADAAAKEGWGFEVVMFKDSETFQRYCEDVQGVPMPDAGAFYSPLDERIVAYLDVADQKDERAWFRDSVLATEAFRLLSDQYAPGPQFGLEQMQERPRYSSLLVQEGLAHGVAGVTVTEQNVEFYGLHHLGAKAFKDIYKVTGDSCLFRIRDVVECRNYGQCMRAAVNRARELEVNAAWAGQNAVGVFIPTACQIAYFFQHHRINGAYAYRAKWWSFLKDEYQGKHALSHFNDSAGIEAFKKAFEIENDADWDAIEKEFLDFTLALTPQEVKGDSHPIEPPKND